MVKLKTQSKQKWNDKNINGKKSLFFNDKEILLLSCYDIIMKHSEFSELSKDYIAEMPVKLGLFQSIKIILGPSDAWSKRQLTQQPRVLYWRLSNFKFKGQKSSLGHLGNVVGKNWPELVVK